MCDTWAATGECTKNAAFMVGDRTRPGSCLVSCRRCDLLQNTQPEAAAAQQEKADAAAAAHAHDRKMGTSRR
jgi:prolyl 4-hydroxylase